MDFLELAKKRHSCRSYSSKPVEEEKLSAIVEAGLHAPSGMNRQSAIALVVTDPKTKLELRKVNAQDDALKRPDPFYGAPALLVVLSKKSVPTHVEDAALMIENMLLEATDLGLGSCYIYRAREEIESETGRKILASLGLNPEDYEGVGNVIVGYPKDDFVPLVHPIQDGRVYKI